AESLGLVREISILGRVEFFTKAYERLRSEASRIHVLHQSISELPRLSIETLLVAAFVAALILVSLRGQDLRDILPLLALYAVAGFRLVPSFNRIVLYANTVRFSAPALRQVAQHYQELRTVRSLPSQTSNPLTIPFGTDLVLENVSFRYEGAEHDALTEISLRVKKGHSVGLVGASGSGKTTIANIMLGLLKPEKGRMLLDGQDVLANLANWQRRIGFIPQDVLILDNSLRHNIALGVEDKDVDDEALREAIRLSRLEGVAASLPDGLDTPLGEKGSRLSGGQRQRIGIARSLYHQPAVLIMDEATSALDNETEREIALSLAAMRGRITMIIVAHRLSTVRHCDMLVFIKAGRVIDAGTFDELNKRNSDFRRMVELGTLDSNPDAAP
ncbi:MAG: ABC transporter ATP-binding protein, partial [Alphaproteobacteria bacterium]|nr:ABC transporter ATP-binding protein [Alphaproteobacteria bacterium]